MAYQALYRQLRPLNFEDVLGQTHVTQTLSNAVKNKKIAHAYLFSGPRGVGKTSTARILARAVNCNIDNNSNPCNECVNCSSILENRSLDVIEIDAASNNGVDEIRDLRDNVKYAPASCKYKVYIIDEVHMLSTAAFNALLKTLEEPPSHVIFVLATTEAHKIPATIKSRCQRFDFHRISKQFIVNHLTHIAKDMGAEISKEALDLITRAADGGMRDAISILDQCLAYSNKHIDIKIVMDLLGAVDDSIFYNITNNIINSDIIAALSEVNTIYHEGHNMEKLLVDFLHYLRSLLELQAGIDNNEIVLSDVTLAKEQAKKFSKENLYSFIHIIVKALNEIKYAKNQRLIVELALLESQFIAENSLAALTARLNNIEQRLYNNKNIIVNKAPINNTVGYSDFVKVLNENDKEKKKETNEPVSKPVAKVEVKQNLDNTKKVANSVSKTPISLPLIERRWDDVLARVKEQDIITNALLKNAKPVEFKDVILTLQFSDDFHMKKIMDEQKKNLIEGILRDVLGDTIQLKGVIGNEQPKAEVVKKIEKPKEDIVQTAIDIFGGEIVSKQN